MMMTPLFLGGLGFQEILLIALIILLLFGGKKIPEMMKGLGRGIRSFKEGMKDTSSKDEMNDSASKENQSKE